jgi:hypothetical protein
MQEFSIVALLEDVVTNIAGRNVIIISMRRLFYFDSGETDGLMSSLGL